MQQANSPLIDAGGGTTPYVQKVESNQNQRSQEKKKEKNTVSSPNFNFLLMLYFQLTWTIVSKYKTYTTTRQIAILNPKVPEELVFTLQCDFLKEFLHCFNYLVKDRREQKQ